MAMTVVLAIKSTSKCLSYFPNKKVFRKILYIHIYNCIIKSSFSLIMGIENLLKWDMITYSTVQRQGRF